jgi:Rod binding domain-containing protein
MMDNMINGDLQLALLKRTEQFDKLKNSANKTDDTLRKATDDFEAFFMQQLLDISMKNSKIAGEGTGSEIIKGLYIENIAKSSTGTLGISDMLYKFLSENKK